MQRTGRMSTIHRARCRSTQTFLECLRVAHCHCGSRMGSEAIPAIESTSVRDLPKKRSDLSRGFVRGDLVLIAEPERVTETVRAAEGIECGTIPMEAGEEGFSRVGVGEQFRRHVSAVVHAQDQRAVSLEKN